MIKSKIITILTITTKFLNPICHNILPHFLFI
nr:MAG TPA: hypothetical protein [Caudoviricetes sp.]